MGGSPILAASRSTVCTKSLMRGSRRPLMKTVGVASTLALLRFLDLRGQAVARARAVHAGRERGAVEAGARGQRRHLGDARVRGRAGEHAVVVRPELALVLRAHRAQGQVAGARVDGAGDVGVARLLQRVVLEVEDDAVRGLRDVAGKGARDRPAVRAQEIRELHHADRRLRRPLEGSALQVEGLHRSLLVLAARLLREVLLELLRIVEDLLQPPRLLLRDAGLLLVALRVASRGRGAARRRRAHPQRRRARTPPAPWPATPGPCRRPAPRRRGRAVPRPHPAMATRPSLYRMPDPSGGAVAAGGEQDHERQRVDRIGEQAQLAEGLDQRRAGRRGARRPRPGTGSRPASAIPAAVARVSGPAEQAERAQERERQREHEAEGGDGNAAHARNTGCGRRCRSRSGRPRRTPGSPPPPPARRRGAA